MGVKLLSEQHLGFLNLTRGCTGSSESTLVKMPHCWKSRVTAQIYNVAYGVNFITKVQGHWYGSVDKGQYHNCMLKICLPLLT